jgi:hypothetical protein
VLGRKSVLGVQPRARDIHRGALGKALRFLYMHSWYSKLVIATLLHPTTPWTGGTWRPEIAR